jgi:hypothetical protein
MKEVAKDSRLRDPKKIDHIFTKEDTSKLAHIGGCAGLVGLDIVPGNSHGLKVDVVRYFAKGHAWSRKNNVPHIEDAKR